MTPPKNSSKRIVIYPKDVELLTGRSMRASQRLLQSIKKHLGKEKSHFVTISEFCACTGLDEQKVTQLIA